MWLNPFQSYTTAAGEGAIADSTYYKYLHYKAPGSVQRGCRHGCWLGDAYPPPPGLGGSLSHVNKPATLIADNANVTSSQAYKLGSRNLPAKYHCLKATGLHCDPAGQASTI